ncbi:hypothetical protein CQ052_00555 [Ochrobactrum sp. MYb15]|nr:hypothetical protein CWE02_10890 [Brucella pituitosa]PQZ49147.1 hypothetical protein CQZ90_11430 [Ochrobactrum sp. MYb19]PRA57648.1 hypothetical protein CQ062_02550 [Ochrobactrum sp. MYb68]PRA67035.1 hypothetical protein CQ053_06895 [Ochrobactrum sp. MYb18]PRA75935.1 hypothetical protein CQ049_00555 [Brucella thiophenivorans]PRA88934.1 hypothetical protein CQ054_02000 [Ochrobactrum sp. MYb29]PRA92046.1 hypothetical protein CQ051_07910 [Ochrobactrum sp. MYb14]PRA97941.1 hypothetical protei
MIILALKSGTRIGIAGANLLRVPADLTTSRVITDKDGFGSGTKLKFCDFFCYEFAELVTTNRVSCFKRNDCDIRA